MINWNVYFYYDETSYSCLRRKHNSCRGRGYSILIAREGAEVGTLRNAKDHYYAVHIFDKSISVHRIIWEMHFGEIQEGFTIDHIDGDTKNNKLSNLRCISREVNNRNKKKHKNNTSGTTGVRLVTYKSNGYENPYWGAFWIEGGTNKQKLFPIKKLGYQLARQEAEQYREYIISVLNSKGYAYTDRHGE